MIKTPRTRLGAYGVALLAPTVTLLACRLFEEPILGDNVLFLAFVPAVLIAAYLGGFWPGLLATTLSALGAIYYLVKPLGTLAVTTVDEAVGLALFVLASAVISSLSEALHRSWRRLAANERRYAATLASIGDAVIATDREA